MKFKPGTKQRTLIVAITLFVLTLPVVPVSATDIDAMTLTYDFGSQILAVNVTHSVSNNKTHYVETIEIWRNGISVLNQTYENQTYLWGEYDTFSISASVGDNVTVTATELKGDSFTSWLIVTGSTATNSVTDTTSTTSTETDSSETTTTTAPDGPESPDTPANIVPVVAVGVFLVVFFIVLFAWLNPDKVPEVIKQLGARIKGGLSRIWIGIGNLFSQIKAKINSK